MRGKNNMTIAIVNHGLGIATYGQLVEAERAASRARVNEADKLSGKPGDHLFFDAAVAIHERADARLKERIASLLAFDISAEALELIRHHHDNDEQSWFEALDDTWRTTVHKFSEPMSNDEIFHVDITDSDPRVEDAAAIARGMEADAQHEMEVDSI